MISPKAKLQAKYKVGDTIPVRFIERIDQHSWIVSVDGSLIRVRNLTLKKVNEGDIVLMRWVSVDPTELAIAEN